MEFSKARMAVLAVGLVMLLALPNLSWAADDTASLYKTRCAACHGADGLAATPIAKKAPIRSFASEEVRNRTQAELEDAILNGGAQRRPSHAFVYRGMTKEEATRLAALVKELGAKK